MRAKNISRIPRIAHDLLFVSFVVDHFLFGCHLPQKSNQKSPVSTTKARRRGSIPPHNPPVSGEDIYMSA